jgi:hypothetical protein
MLPSKTIPEAKNRKHHALKPRTKLTAAATAPPRKKARITSGTEVELIEDEDSPRVRQSTTISPSSSFQVSYPVPVKVQSMFHNI